MSIKISPPANNMLVFEKKIQAMGFNFVAGIDEAGRGPLAGPVVAAAVVLRDFHFQNPIRDSKTLTPLQRQKAFHEILEKAHVGIGMMSELVIDRHNILEATFLAMNNAVRQLIDQLAKAYGTDSGWKKELYLIVDGNRFKTDLPFPYETVIEGDGRSLSIAGASIVAKVFRDRILCAYDRIYPQYGFYQHKGYATEQHCRAIRKYGLSDIHRRTFTLPAARPSCIKEKSPADRG